MKRKIMKLSTLFYNAVCALLLIAAPAAAEQFSPVQVSKNIYAFIGDTGMRSYENAGMNANSGFIVTKAGVIVVDSGSTYLVAKAMHEAIKKISHQPVKYVINTGGQDHRWLGNGYFREQGAQIIASRKALADMQERGNMELAALQPELREKLAGTKIVYPERLFDQADTLKLGGEEIQVLFFNGGHTPGDAVVWLPIPRALFSGDLVFVDRMLGILPVSNSKDWLASVEKIEKLNPKVIIPGHGKVCDLIKARHDTREYLTLLR
jgi:glyoxylase-like metal-dependent hydrolase (beta-lactamase superfamily II)